MNIKNIVNPTKVIQVKIHGQDVKITLQGTTPYDEAYIELPKFQQYTSKREAEKAGREYVRRVLSFTIKKIEGLKLENETGELVDFKLETMPDDENELTLDTYNKLMRIFDKYCDEDVFTQVLKFYNNNRERELPKAVGIESKKKV